MFDSPLQSAANSTISTATIGGKVAAAFSAAASYFFDDSALFPLLLLLPRVAARRRGAVRRRPRRLRRRSRAAAFSTRLGRAAYASPASPAALRRVQLARHTAKTAKYYPIIRFLCRCSPRRPAVGPLRSHRPSFRRPQPALVSTRTAWYERGINDDVAGCSFTRCRWWLLRHTNQARPALDWCALCVQPLLGGDRWQHLCVVSAVHCCMRAPSGWRGSTIPFLRSGAPTQKLPLSRSPAACPRWPKPTAHVGMSHVTERHLCGGVGCVRSELSSSVAPCRVWPLRRPVVRGQCLTEYVGRQTRPQRAVSVGTGRA